MNYDDWKLSPPEYPADFDFQEQAIDKNQGVFSWQRFCHSRPQYCVETAVWQTCKKGPFITPVERLIFWANLAVARLKGMQNPIQAAGWMSLAWVNSAYVDACVTVEETWKESWSFHDLKAIEEDDGSISLYRCNFEKP